MKKDVYAIITEQIIKKLETGVVPWHKPWSTQASAPKNLVSLKPYQGINAIVTHMQGFLSPYWMTFKQCQELGGNVKQGEKGTPIVYWNIGKTQKENKNSGELEDKSFAFLKYFTVFNLDQTEGIKLSDKFNPKLDLRTEVEKIEICENIVKGYLKAPQINIKPSNRACYSPSLDVVEMPEQKQFQKDEMFYSVLFHELTHSTGHKSRLNRTGIVDLAGFRSHSYSFEELIAEFGAAFLSGHAGIETKTLDESASYIKSWLEVLKKDSKMLVKAAGQAQKAANLILNIKSEKE